MQAQPNSEAYTSFISKIKTLFYALFVASALLKAEISLAKDSTQYWMKIKASDKFQRTLVANTGVSIELAKDEFLYATGNKEEMNLVKKLGLLDVTFPLTKIMDFPAKDGAYHNYTEVTSDLKALVANHSNIMTLSSIGKSTEGREIWVVRLGTQQEKAHEKPAIIFMGGHHSREHLSVEIPMMAINYFVTEYKQGNPKIVSLINSRDIHIIPAVNPDGLEYDIKDGSYKSWRKNRRNNGDGTYGVDLNRNYGFQWGTGGSSKSTDSDVYMGPHAFSEVETIAVKNYIEAHTNISILLSFHTFSELILYPWGHKYDRIENDKAYKVHEAMAKKMAEWNRYRPQQSSELYVASGDTTDWSFGVHGIISFTFELDPANQFGNGGFYPGANIIQNVFNKNIDPILYLTSYADNPYRVLDTGTIGIGSTH
jgi:carboxypeptidase T